MKVMSIAELDYLYVFKVEHGGSEYMGYVPKDLLTLMSLWISAGNPVVLDLNYYTRVLSFYLEAFDIEVKDESLWLPSFSKEKFEFSKYFLRSKNGNQDR